MECQVYRLLEDPDAADELVLIPLCLIPAWLQALMEEFPQLRGQEFLAT